MAQFKKSKCPKGEGCLVSRAKWVGSVYFRKRSGTWRKYGGKKDGQVFSGDEKRPVSEISGEIEPTYDNYYSRDKFRPKGSKK